MNQEILQILQEHLHSNGYTVEPISISTWGTPNFGFRRNDKTPTNTIYQTNNKITYVAIHNCTVAHYDLRDPKSIDLLLEALQ